MNKIDHDYQIALRSLNKIGFDKMLESEKLSHLQSIENFRAREENRPPVPIRSEDLPNDYGQYNINEKSIEISKQALSEESIHENIKTTLHEGRHAYQDYAIQNPGFHPNPEEVSQWGSPYISPDKDYDAYYNHSSEIDARAAEEDIHIIYEQQATITQNDASRELVRNQIIETYDYDSLNLSSLDNTETTNQILQISDTDNMSESSDILQSLESEDEALAIDLDNANVEDEGQSIF